jgi:TFIIF-interacting CTD phosphatase-like protein
MPRPSSPPAAIAIKKEEDDEDHKDSERLQARLRELAMEKTKPKQTKEDKNKKHKKRID